MFLSREPTSGHSDNADDDSEDDGGDDDGGWGLW